MKKLRVHFPQPVDTNDFELAANSDTVPPALVDAIRVTSEICGQSLSIAAARILAGDLAEFDENAILAALSRCRMEVQGRLKVGDIIVRIADGRPDVDEAWSLLPMDEAASTVWTEDMAQAWGMALPLLESGDGAGARRVFAEHYARAVQAARVRRDPVRWMPSLGRDMKDRERALADAVKKGRLSAAQVENLLPPGDLSRVVGAPAQAAPRNLH